MSTSLFRVLLSGPAGAAPGFVAALTDAGYPAAIPSSVEYASESGVGWVELLCGDVGEHTLGEATYAAGKVTFTPGSVQDLAQRHGWAIRDHGSYQATEATHRSPLEVALTRLEVVEARLAAMERN